MRLRSTRWAAGQLDTILDRLPRLSPQSEVSVARRMSEMAFVLSDHPFIGRQTSRARVRRVPLVPFPYVIDCHVDEKDIVILDIRHTSRKPIP